MEIGIGKKGLELTFQASFPEEVLCKACSDATVPKTVMARIAFVAAEESGEEEYVCKLHQNEGNGSFWPHDAIAVAIYFCPECRVAVTLWNQA